MPYAPGAGEKSEAKEKSELVLMDPRREPARENGRKKKGNSQPARTQTSAARLILNHDVTARILPYELQTASRTNKPPNSQTRLTAMSATTPILLLLLLTAVFFVPALSSLPDLLRVALSSVSSLGHAIVYTALAALALVLVGGIIFVADHVTAWLNPPPPRASAGESSGDAPNADSDDEAWLEKRKHKSLGPGEKREGLTERILRKTREHEEKKRREREAAAKAAKGKRWEDGGSGIELEPMGSSSGMVGTGEVRRRMPPPPPPLA